MFVINKHGEPEITGFINFVSNNNGVNIIRLTRTHYFKGYIASTLDTIMNANNNIQIPPKNQYWEKYGKPDQE